VAGWPVFSGFGAGSQEPPGPLPEAAPWGGMGYTGEMAKWLLRGGLLVLACVAGFTACRLMWPDAYVFNAPIRSTLIAASVRVPSEELFGRRIRAAEGFSASLYAEVAGARMLVATEAGDLLVSSPQQSAVLLLERDGDGDGRPDGQRALLSELDRPHGLDLRDGWLYIAEGSALGRIRFDVQAGRVQGELERIVTGLPNGGNHWRRMVRAGPDGWLYAAIGSSCNVCFEKDERRGAMLRFRPDGSGGHIYATGLRNSSGYDWQPGSGDLYATDNGRDLLGDDFPPCELNLVVEDGDYGWPVANGARVLDPDLGVGFESRALASIPPAFDFPAHNAPLGIRFLRHAPPGYENSALVGLHGSWNRTKKDGYKVVSLHWAPDGTIRSRDFLWGFLEDEDVIGRPVDAAETPDGAIFISDDYAGAVYRVVWRGESN